VCEPNTNTDLSRKAAGVLTRRALAAAPGYDDAFRRDAAVRRGRVQVRRVLHAEAPRPTWPYRPVPLALALLPRHLYDLNQIKI
jgi:hypothetical protein